MELPNFTDAILQRATFRGSFTAERPPNTFFTELEQHDLVALRWLSEPERRLFRQLTIRATREMITDRDQLFESDRWVRHGHSWSAKHVDGLTSEMQCLGHPVTWISDTIPRLSADRSHQIWLQRTRDVHLREAHTIGLFSLGRHDSLNAYVELGRQFQRLSLIAARYGLSVHALNQTMERRDRELHLGQPPSSNHGEILSKADQSPALAFRIGFPRGKPPSSPRRTVEDILKFV